MKKVPIIALLLLSACGVQVPESTVTVQVQASSTEPIILTMATETPQPTMTPTETITPAPTALPTEIIDAMGVEMVLVPEGDFIMGSDSWSKDERPAHQVYLDSYYIDKYEVTNVLYKACVDMGKCDPPFDTNFFDNSRSAEHPVVYVSWNMAKGYCEWRDARLPTEAEWEKAARGTDERTYPWGNEMDDSFLNHLPNLTKPVGSYTMGISPYGVYDMAGNVWEWVADWYDESYYARSPGVSPLGPEEGNRRVLRGGAIYTGDVMVRTTVRGKIDPITTDSRTGFRCAR